MSEGEGRVVGLLLEPSVERIAAQLAVLWMGCTYLPLSTADPDIRLEAVVRLTKATVLITTDEYRERAARICGHSDAVHIVDIAAVLAIQPFSSMVDRPCDASPTRTAYIITTSGTTGEPKGVPIHHRAVLNMVLTMQEMLSIGKTDRVIHLHAFTFDLSVFDMLGSICTGATGVIPVRNGHRDMHHVSRLVECTGVTLWNSVPAWMQMLVTYCAPTKTSAQLNSIRAVMLSGDIIPTTFPATIQRTLDPSGVRNIRQVHPKVYCLGARLKQLSGTQCFYRRGTGSVLKLARIPLGHKYALGRPFAGNEIHIMRRGGRQPCPPGFGARSVTQVFSALLGTSTMLNVTLLRLQTHPETGVTLYRSGDLGYIDRNGVCFISGRCDNQVKVNGFRVDLAAIESTLSNHPAIRTCAVSVIQNDAGIVQLVAVVVNPESKDTPATSSQAPRSEHDIPIRDLSQLAPAQFDSIADYIASVQGAIDYATIKTQQFGVRRQEEVGARKL